MNGETDVSYGEVADAWGGLFTPQAPASEPYAEVPSYPVGYGPASQEFQTVGPTPVEASGDISGFFGDLFRGVGRVAEAAATSVARSTGGILAASLARRPVTPSVATAPTLGFRGLIPGYPGSGGAGGGPGGLPGFASPGQTNPLGFLMSPWVIIGLMGAVFVLVFLRRR